MIHNRPIKILLADDDPDDIFFFQKALLEIPIATRLNTVRNGEELINYLKQNSAWPDVIFLDLNMPRKTGHECLSEIKNSEAYRHLPVVIYSTSYIPEVADILYHTGANYYVQKCDFLELPKRLEQVLAKIAKSAAQPARNGFFINENIPLTTKHK